MALIDALMAGQQFVAGMQQQQQMAREYRDRMAMLARDEERAMRQEERQMMADFRTQEMQDFEMGLARSAEERAQEQFAREGVTSRLTNEQIRQSIKADKLQIAELERQAANAATREEREAIEFELRERLTRVQLAEAEAAQSARMEADEAAREFRMAQSALTNVARQVQIDPASLTAEQALAAEQTMYNFLDKNADQIQAFSPYYTAFFNALEEAEKAEGSLLTKKGIRSQYATQYKMPATSGNFAGPLQIVDPRQVLSRENYMSGLEAAYDPLEQYRNLRDRRENFLNIIGQPFANALVGMLPQED